MKSSRSILFYFCCCACILFLASPLILRYLPQSSDIIAFILQPLGSQEYKSTYIETIGAILGGFLAISGAIWTQNKIDSAKETKEIQTTAIIIYLDLEITLENIKHILKTYFNNAEDHTINVLKDIDGFKRELNLHPFKVDKHWIQNIARISDVFSDNEFEMIKTIYKHIVRIECLINTDELTKDKLEQIYKLMNDLFSLDFELKYPLLYDYSLKESVKAVYNKIKTIAELKDDSL